MSITVGAVIGSGIILKPLSVAQSLASEGWIYLRWVALGLVCLFGAFAYADVTRELPSIEILPRLLNPPDGLLLQPTRIYDRSGLQLLFTFEPENSPRRYIPVNPQNPQHIPENRVKAVIPGKVEHIQYDQYGPASSPLVLYPDLQRLYQIASNGIVVGREVRSGSRPPIKPANVLPTRSVPVGATVRAR